MKKIGRNEPCPCGSGRKFKHCHLGREEELLMDGSDFTDEMSRSITSLPEVAYGRCQEFASRLDVKQLTGSDSGIRFIDIDEYRKLDLASPRAAADGSEGAGSVLVNLLKTGRTDPHNVYLAVSRQISDGVLVHQIAHVLDYLGGSGLITGMSKALSFDLGIPVEHLEHPHEFGYRLDYLADLFQVQLDADDTIVRFLYKEGMLIKAASIRSKDRGVIKSKSDSILAFLSSRSQEIDSLICELPGYIGYRKEKS